VAWVSSISSALLEASGCGGYGKNGKNMTSYGLDRRSHEQNGQETFCGSNNNNGWKWKYNVILALRLVSRSKAD
jgi:hypothetical protein